MYYPFCVWICFDCINSWFIYWSYIKYKERVFDLLRILEMNGGEEALKVIKKKIPTYMSSV